MSGELAAGLMQGRRGLVVGIANERSIAYGIARAARAAGARLMLTYQHERFEGRVRAIGDGLQADDVVPCDVAQDADIAHLADAVRSRWGGLDFVVHAVAHARREELEGRYLDTSRAGFAEALDVSAYSLVALVRALEEVLVAGCDASVLTLTYYGAEKAVPNYNVMGVAKAALEASVRYLASELGPRGIRVNAISAGPIKTLSAAGVRGLRRMLERVEQEAPLRRNVGIEDVGHAAVYALSQLGRGMTGEIIHVDAGYHVLGA